MPTPIILFGGRSDERHVSVASAQNLARIVDHALCWFWDFGGAVHDVAASELIAHQRPFESDYVPSRPAIWPDLEQALDTVPVEDPVFVLALHGGEGEDGTVQAMLERRGLPFTGSGADASAKAFDKGRAKETVHGGVRTAESQIARSASQLENIARELLSRHSKIVLKPLAGGSSRGLFFLDHSDDFESVIAQVVASARLNQQSAISNRQSNIVPYILEQFLAGRELTVGVIDRGDGALALPVIEIETDPGAHFDYAGKYLGKGTREICPAKIPDEMREDAQRTAVIAHETLGCSGYSRSDLIATPEGVYFLELNTLPGLTTSSLVPQELREIGVTLHEFINEQMQLAMRRVATKT